jgi:DNA polymerase-3 subunit delta
MAVYKHNDISKALIDSKHGNILPVYLIHGERYLCRNASDELLDCLLGEDEKRSSHLHEIDGDKEDFSRTENLLRTYSLFAGRQIFRVTDTKLFLAKGSAKNLWGRVQKAYEAQEPDQAARYFGQLLELSEISATENADEFLSLSANRWKTIFGFAKPQGNLDWLQVLFERLRSEDAPSLPSQDKSEAAERFMKTFTAGIPTTNILILLAETVDKRNKLYKFIKEKGCIFDLEVDAGASKAARTEQEEIIKDLVNKTLKDFDKKIAPQAFRTLLERIGFHPVAAVKETEKLALYTSDNPSITSDDVNVIIGRTREEALYELTEALGAKKLETALLILERLLENGIHALAILATIRNQLKKMILIHSAQRLTAPQYSSKLPFPVFQKQYLPALKEGREDWAALWSGHPYGLFILFRQTANFSAGKLLAALREVLSADYQLKGSLVPPRLVLENLIFNLLFDTEKERQFS